jgi:uncharacterized protein (TIGR01244 family)
MKHAAIVLPVGLLLSGIVVGQPIAAQADASKSPLLPIRNGRIPMQGVLSGGQPDQEQIAAAARAGFRTVINLRTEKEPGFEWEAEAVVRHGMRYVLIPVAGAEGLTRDNVERVDVALREGIESGPVLLHCGSGNRIGAILALRERWLKGTDPQAALQYGLAAGLTRLEPTTRELLGLSSEPKKE